MKIKVNNYFSVKHRYRIAFSLVCVVLSLSPWSATRTLAQNTLDLVGLTSATPSAAAYSLRRLSTSYTGNLIKVRRSSDSTTLDIGYDSNGCLDTSSLKTFVGGGNGYVARWYDQSGNGNDAIMDTLATQPNIVGSGTIIRSNGIAAVSFGSSKGMATTSNTILTNNASLTANLVGISTSSTVTARRLVQGTGGNNWIIGPYNAQYGYFSGGFDYQSGTWSQSSWSVITATQDAVPNLYISGSAVTLSNSYRGYPGGIGFGVSGSYSGQSALAQITEALFFNSSISATDRKSLECSQLTAYVPISGASTLCQGTTASMTEFVSGGVWSSSNTSLATIGSSTGTLTGVSAGTLTITYTTAAGCAITKLVTVNPSPTIVGDNVTTCSGNAKTLTASGGASYTWSPSTGLSATTGSTVTATLTANTTYTVTGSNSYGCSSAATYSVSISNPLDIVGLSCTATPAAAYSLRRLSSSYSGSLIQVRRSSDSSTQNIGYDSYGWLDTNSLKTFVGTGDGFVAKWYDQSGNSLDATQTNLSLQSPIILSGIVQRMPGSGMPAIYTNIAGQSLSSSLSFNGVSGLTLNTVIERTAINAGQSGHIAAPQCPTASTPTTFQWDYGSANAYFSSSVSAHSGYYVIGNSSVLTAMAVTSGSAQVYLNGNAGTASGTPFSTGITTASTMYFWSHPSQPARCFLGYSSEFIFFKSALSTTDQQTMECNQLQAYYFSIAGSSTVCAGSSTTLTHVTAGGTWSSSNTAVATVVSYSGNVTGVSAGAAVITYTAPSGCIFTKSITVNPSPTIVGDNVTTCSGYATTLTASGGVSYTWEPASGLSATTGSAVTATLTANTTYTVTGTNSYGCSNTASYTVSISNPLDIAGLSCTATPAAAYSLRRLSTSFSGNLIQVRRSSDSTLLDIGYDSNGWLDTSSLKTFVGSGDGLVAKWYDQSGNSLDATQTNLTLQSPIILSGIVQRMSGSGMPAIYTNTAGQSLSSSLSFNGVTGLSLNTVLERTALNAGNNGVIAAPWFPTGGTNTTFQWFLSTGNCYFGSSLSAHSVSYTTGTPSVLTAVAVTSGSAQVYLNGSTGTASGAPFSTTGFTTASTIYFWSHPSQPARCFLGYSSEFIFFKSPLSTVDRKSLECGQMQSYFGITGISAVCVGNSTLLSDNISGGTWSSSNTAIATIGTTGNVAAMIAGTAVITYNTASGCAITKTITVNALPTIVGSSVAICSGSSTTLAIAGGISYSWSPATGLSATTGSSVTASPTSTTTYTVAATNATGCVNTASDTVTVNALPTISGGSSVAICIGSSTTLTATGGVSYNWSPATGLSATTGTSVTASPTSTTSYTVTGTNATGCVNTATVTVTVNALPSIGGGSSVAICSGSSTSLTATGGVSYSWSPATGLSATTGSSVTASPTSTTTYTVTGTNAIGCVNTASVTVTVNALPTIGAGSSVAICSGSSTSFTATGGVSYSWSPATGLSATTGSSVMASPTSTTTYTVAGTNANGCVNTASVIVTVNALPAISGGSSVAICSGSSTMLMATGGVTYNWSPATGLSATTGTSVIASPTSTSTYTLTGTDASGCVNTATVTVTVNALPTINGGSSVAICSGSSTILTATGGVSYSWSPATGLSATTGSSVTASPTSTITYTVTGTNANGCVNTASVIVTVNALPTISGGSSLAICSGSSTALTATGGVSYSWSPATGLSATTGSSVTASPTSTTTYTVTGTNGTGCVNTSSVTVTINPLPTISGGANVTIVAGSSTTLTATGGVSYSWSPATGLSATSGSSITASPSATATYTVTGANSYGCVSSASVSVTVTGALDLIGLTSATPAAAAYSLRRLSSTYTGYLVQVRRSSDNTTQNIGYDSNNWLDTSGLKTFVGIGNGFVSKWYDQSGNGYDAVQATTAAQPQIMASGTIVRSNGIVGINLGTGMGMSTSSNTILTDSTNLTSNVVAISTSGSTANRRLVQGTGTNNWFIGPNANNYSYFSGGASDYATTTWSMTRWSVVTATQSSVPNLYIQGSAVTLAHNNKGYPGGIGFGISGYSAQAALANITEAVFFASPLSAPARQTLECSQLNAYLSISGATAVCKGSTAAQTELLAGGAWSSSATSIATIGSSTGTVTGIAAGTATITYTATSGCAITKSFTVNPLATLTSGSSAICSGSSTTLTATGGANYSWAPATGLSATTGSSITANPTTTTTYTMTGTTSTGCVTTATVTVSVINGLDNVGLSCSTPSAAAYSLRRLSSSYTGNLIQVRRSSDSATLNIGYDSNGWLDTNSMKTFVGTGNGFVAKWYDQSGNGIDAAQTTLSSQSPIILSGIVQRMPGSGMPAIYTNTAGQSLSSSLSFNGVTGLSLNSVLARTATNAGNNGVIAAPWYPTGATPTTFQWYFASSAYLSSSVSAHSGSYTIGNPAVLTALAVTSGSAQVYLNGNAGTASSTPFSTGFTTSSPMYFWTQPSQPARCFLGYSSEFIFFKSALVSTDRQTMECSQMHSYFSITGSSALCAGSNITLHLPLAAVRGLHQILLPPPLPQRVL